MRLRTVQSSFTSGELDPRLRKRVDVKHYFNGAERLRDVLVNPQGGAFGRGGLRFLRTLPSMARYTGFKFSDTQSYLLVFSNLLISVYRAGVWQADIVSPFTLAQLNEVTVVNKNNVMLIFHKDVQTRKVVRGASHSSWTLTTVTYDFVPKFNWNPVLSNPATTLAPSAKSGIVSLTAGAATWEVSDVGGYVTGNGGEARITKYESATKVYATVTKSFVDTTAMVSGAWTLERGFEDAWSATRGWPRCGTFHRNRLVVAGSDQLPSTWWASNIGDYFNFDLGSGLDDEGIMFTLDDNEVNTIRHVVSAGHLQFFTSGGPFYVPESDSNALTPLNAKCYKQDNKPISSIVPPLFVDGATLFCQADTNLVREFLWNELDQKYNAGNVTLLSSHLINSPVQMSHEPPNGSRDSDLIYVVNSDGTWAVLNSLRAQEITAWTGGGYNYKSRIRSIYNDAGVTYAFVERTINGSTVYSMEYFEADLPVDGSNTQTSVTDTNTWTGFGHLEGETVHVFVDGYYDGEHEVVSGGFTTNKSGKVMQAGYAIAPLVRMLSPERELPDGTMVGEKKRIVSATVELNGTTSLAVNGKTVRFRRFGDNLFDEPLQPYTGTKIITMLGYKRDPKTEFTMSTPGKLHIVSVVQKVNV